MSNTIPRPSVPNSVLHFLAAAILLVLPLPAAADYDFAKLIQPAPASARFEDPGHIVWCGTMIRDDMGKCHLFYSRWPRKLGHYAWVTHSEVAHAVADNPLGPYKFVDVALPARGKEHWDGLCTHNPTVMKFGGNFTRTGPSLALFESSDGFDWKPAIHPLVSTLDLKWADGTTQKLMKLERPQLVLKDGKPAGLFCAAAPEGKLDESFNVQIPLMEIPESTPIKP